MAFQVVDPRGFNTQADYTGLSQGIGQLIQGQIANHYAKKAEGGNDPGSLAKLASIDPRRGQMLGGLLENRRAEEQEAALREQKEQEKAQATKQDLMLKVARGYTNAKDKPSYLAAASSYLDRAGYKDVSEMVMMDLERMKQDPKAVDQEYTSAVAMYNDEGGGDPAQVQYLNYLTQNMSPEEAENARRVAAGLSPRMTGSSAITTAQMGLTQPVADSEAVISGAKSGASERAKLGAQGDLSPQVKRDEAREGAIGKAEGEREANKPKAAAALRTTLRNVDNTLFTAEKAAGQVSPLTAGAGGKILANFAGTSAKDLRRTIDTLKASLSFDALAEMRRNSPTGGALGSITERELELLGSTVASLNEEQSPEQLKENIGRVITYYNNYKDLVEQAYQGEYGAAQPEAPAAPKRMKYNPATGKLE